MKALSAVDSDFFVASVEPVLARQDQEGLLRLLKKHWTAEQIVSLLDCGHCDARKVAALCLSLVGGKCCIDPLVQRLKDPDPMVNQMAEHALWSIWFRCGTPEANRQLACGTLAVDRCDLDSAARHFTRALELDPTFAEAYNQRAIVRYLQEDYMQSVRDARRAVELMPSHFGAWAGMGHCHAQLCNLQPALAAYQKALSINPHLECLNQAVCQIRQCLRA